MLLTEAVKVNPATGLEYPRVSPQEFIRILNPSDRLGAMVLVAVFTGLRRGELCGLQWQDVKPDFIRVRHAIAKVRGSPKDETPKTKKSISNVPLASEARQAIDSQPRRSKYVFTTSNGGPVSPDNFNRDFRHFRDAIGMPELVPHNLRRTYVSLMLRAGVDLKTIQRNVGHVSPRMIMEVYGETFDESQAESVERFLEVLKGGEEIHDAPRKEA